MHLRQTLQKESEYIQTLGNGVSARKQKQELGDGGRGLLETGYCGGNTVSGREG